jgi:hypothetical protein
MPTLSELVLLRPTLVPSLMGGCSSHHPPQRGPATHNSQDATTLSKRSSRTVSDCYRQVRPPKPKVGHVPAHPVCRSCTPKSDHNRRVRRHRKHANWDRRCALIIGDSPRHGCDLEHRSWAGPPTLYNTQIYKGNRASWEPARAPLTSF